MKVALGEIKKNLKRTNSGVNEAKIQINELEHKEEILIQPEQQKEKEFKKTRIVKGASEISANVPTSES